MHWPFLCFLICFRTIFVHIFIFRLQLPFLLFLLVLLILSLFLFLFLSFLLFLLAYIYMSIAALFPSSAAINSVFLQSSPSGEFESAERPQNPPPLTLSPHREVDSAAVLSGRQPAGGHRQRRQRAGAASRPDSDPDDVPRRLEANALLWYFAVLLTAWSRILDVRTCTYVQAYVCV
eukprot:GHVU01038618.1.p1 GENE.GHVU01038618.1~~GHVU01038618.1.p1  ORF type:complete len:177 (+),score=10.16 GHVU01038618.1:301-831(+)